MSRIKQVIDTLEAERAEVQERLAWLERQITEFRKQEDGASATPAKAARPGRADRRSTARRASRRRATARTMQPDLKGEIVGYLEKHPGSTAGDIAKALNRNRNSVATRLTQMAKGGQITKQPKGYSVD